MHKFMFFVRYIRKQKVRLKSCEKKVQTENIKRSQKKETKSSSIVLTSWTIMDNNMWKLIDALPNFLFTPSETKRDYQ